MSICILLADKHGGWHGHRAGRSFCGTRTEDSEWILRYPGWLISIPFTPISFFKTVSRTIQIYFIKLMKSPISSNLSKIHMQTILNINGPTAYWPTLSSPECHWRSDALAGHDQWRCWLVSTFFFPLSSLVFFNNDRQQWRVVKSLVSFVIVQRVYLSMTKLFYPWQIVVQTLLSTVRFFDESCWALCILRVWWPIVWRLLNCCFIALSVKEDTFSHEKARTQNWDISISSFTESLSVNSWECKSLCGFWTNMGS